MKFTRLPIDVDAQIALLRQRGLLITDENIARHLMDKLRDATS
ncbi:hypothetical protein DFQ45_10671 [Thiopseudomonas denitrificans]|uniref:Uncharacterized protein n=1 Tax=Thiopseudomonas denitrificans TaxID=1501432 RepID=A0A4R6U0N3_9GAMM|nr:hypothetical protein DFQ45_10671 [Thiopseudomonas denitrificans]